MTGGILRIDSTEISNHVARLGAMSRSALPVAARQTLTKAAFDVKMNTMPKESEIMIHRKPTFFKANSKAVPAQGFDMKTMYSEVGFIPKIADKSHSVEDLEEQEHGGNISGRSFVPLDDARIAGHSTMVKAGNRLSKIRNKLIDPELAGGKSGVTDKSKFIKSAIFAKSHGGRMLSTWHNRVYQVMGTVRDGKDTRVIYKELYKVRKHGKASVKNLNFMQKASLDSATKMEGYFKECAEITLEKYR